MITTTDLATLGADFRNVAARLAGLDTPRGRVDFDARDIIATVYDGAYGPAGLVLAINGSPPRGTFLVPREAIGGADWATVVYLDAAMNTRRLSCNRLAADYAIVTRYARAVWRAKGERVEGTKEDYDD
jgi:hypothetical protein